MASTVLRVVQHCTVVNPAASTFDVEWILVVSDETNSCLLRARVKYYASLFFG